MKKEELQAVKETINDIIKNINLKVYLFNYESISNNISELNNKINTLIDTKHEVIYNVKNDATTSEEKIEKIKDIQSVYEKILNDYSSEKKLLETILKAYTNIINNGIYLILNDIIFLIINHCKNKRDLNEVLRLFDYDTINKCYKLPYTLYYSEYYNYFSIEIPKKNGFNKYIYLYYTIENNKIIFDTKNFDHAQNVESISNYAEYYKPINNIFGYNAVEKNCIELLKTYEIETKKQTDIISKSNQIINNKNIYNINGFIKYNI